MLDVHPPHGPTHTWREFFIHLATIVIGLLIAVGIEQVVERVHASYELHDAREAIEGEMRSNVANRAMNERNWLEAFAMLKNNMQVLQFIRAHPDVPQSELPGDLRWILSPYKRDHAVWDSAIKKGTIQFMPREEANKNQLFYSIMEEQALQSLQTWDAINAARQFDILDTDPTHLSPAELNEVIRHTEFALSKLVQMGYTFGRMARTFPEMGNDITYSVLQKLRPEAIDVNPTGLAAAHQRTDDRINAVLAELKKPAVGEPGTFQLPISFRREIES